MSSKRLTIIVAGVIIVVALIAIYFIATAQGAI